MGEIPGSVRMVALRAQERVRLAIPGKQGAARVPAAQERRLVILVEIKRAAMVPSAKSSYGSSHEQICNC